MTLRIPSLAALPPCLAAAAAFAAPPLVIPVRPLPEPVAVEDFAENDFPDRAVGASDSGFAPSGSLSTNLPGSSSAMEPSPPVTPAVPLPETSRPEPPIAAPAPKPAEPADPKPEGLATPKPATAKPAEFANAATNEVFRRDPFWPVSIARQRKADHDARIAARIEAEKRAAAIKKARDEAIRKGLDVEEMDDDELVNLGGGAPAVPAGPKASSSFGGASGEEWDAAFAKLPPRAGYLGGRKPALMLKGDRTPHYVGDRLCVTNRGVVFTWKVSSVDFRAYAHELKRVSAKPVPPDKNQTP